MRPEKIIQGPKIGADPKFFSKGLTRLPDMSRRRQFALPPAHSLLAAAAATAGIVASVSAGAAIVAAAAIAEEEQQDNDPPAVVSTAAIVAATAIAAAIVATTAADQEQQDDDPPAIIPATVTAIPHMFASLFDKRTALLLRYSTRIRQDLCLFPYFFAVKSNNYR
jgi:hypothetical protein